MASQRAAPCTADVPLRRVIQRMRATNISYEDALKEFQIHYVSAVLLSNRMHLGHTAAALKIHPNTLTRMIRKLGLDVVRMRKEIRQR